MVYFAGLSLKINLRPLSKTAGKIQIVDEHDNESPGLCGSISTFKKEAIICK
jgi:hypothetical protein